MKWQNNFLILALLFSVPSQVQAQLYGIENDTGSLYSISTTDATLSYVGNTGVIGIGSLEYRKSNGLLYGFSTGGSPVLYAIDPSDASTVSVGSLGNEFVFEGGLAITADGTAFGTNKQIPLLPFGLSHELFTIDLDSGATSNVGAISGILHDINGLGVRSDGKLVGLDRPTNSLLEIDTVTATSTVIAAITPTVGGVGGISLTGDVGYFSTSGPLGSVSGSNELHSFDPFTGAHTLIGSFAPSITGSGISGIAMIPVPEPSTFVLASFCVSIIAMRRKR